MKTNITLIPISNSLKLAKEYVNLREGYRAKTNEELYEGWMRGDFSNARIPFKTFDSVRIVRI